jgi:hypothetical protein
MVVKYKQLTKLKDINLIPSRVLKFKRPKWGKIKTSFYSRFSKEISSSIFNSTDSIMGISFWNKITKNYKENLLTKRKYKHIFGENLSTFNCKNKLSALSSILTPFYSPKFIFFIFNFTSSKNSTKQKIFFKQTSLNESILTQYDLRLNSGDILQLKEKSALLNNYNKFNTCCNVSICELDIYSQQFIFIKNKAQLSEEDVENIFFEKFNVF